MNIDEIQEKIKKYKGMNQVYLEKLEKNEQHILNLKVSLELEKAKNEMVSRGEIAILEIYWESNKYELWEIKEFDGDKYESIKDYKLQHPEKTCAILILHKTDPDTGDNLNSIVEPKESLDRLTRLYSQG
jgi:hypothetical protein